MNIKKLKARAAKAWSDRTQYETELCEIYDYVLPWRDVSGLGTYGRSRQQGQSRTDLIFDQTAPRAAARFAGRLQAQLTPLFQSFFALEPGPLIVDERQKKDLIDQLQTIGRVVAAAFQTSNFHNSTHEMYLDLFAGTAAMFIDQGDAAMPVRFMVVLMPQIALAEGPWGDIWHIWYRRSWPAGEIPDLWPEQSRYSTALKNAIKGNEEAPVEVTQYTYYDSKAKVWRLVVWTQYCEGEEAKPLHEREFRVCPWVTPRLYKIPGEPYGRGPAHMALPTIKTTNMARELALKAAAFALMGLWMRRHDGVFNPDTVDFAPLQFWTVGSTGGVLGPSIARLPVPENFDISSVVIQDEREQMKMALFDETLPAETGAVRSATEIAERVSRLSQDFAGVYGRLTLELIVPAVRRVIEILETSGVINTALDIDQLLTQVRVVAPIATGQQAAKVESATRWMEIMAMMFGPEAAAIVAKVELMGPEIGRWLGVDDRFIRSPDEMEKLQRAMAQAVAAKQQQEVAAEAAASAPPPTPHQQYVNGGMA